MEVNMNTQNTPQNSLEYTTVSLKLKLAALWTSFMFLYTYVDYFHFYMPGMIEDILAGKVYTFDITYVFLLIVMILVAIPAFMIFLSVALPNKVNRWVNPIVAAVFIPYMLFNLVGEAWPHMYFAAALEVAHLCLIMWYARKLPTSL
jgi:hypothetical protein